MNKTEIEIEHIGLFALDHELVSYKRSYNNHRTLRERDRLAADNGIDLAFAETKELVGVMHTLVRQKVFLVVGMFKTFDNYRYRSF